MEGPGKGEIDLDLLVDAEYEGAGIFEAPLDVGYGEGTSGMELAAADLHFHGHIDLVRRTEESEEAIDDEGGVAGRIEGSCEMAGGEGNGLESRGLELVVGHAVVAGRVAALAAEGVDDDGAGGLAGGGIEVDISLLDIEGAVHNVEDVTQGKVHFAVGGVERELFLCMESRSRGGSDEQECIPKEIAYNNATGPVAGRR